MKGNLRFLDALRGLLALYVLLGHARWLLWQGWQTWQDSTHPAWANAAVTTYSVFRYGHEAVMVFFALSGFFIHLKLAQRLTDGHRPDFDMAIFFVRRFWRLAPPYFAALVLTVAADLVGRMIYPGLYQGTTSDALLDANFRLSGYSALSVLPAIVMLPKSLGIGFGSNGPLWSLAYEVAYYLVYPLWWYLRRSNAAMAYSVVPVAFACSLLPWHNFLLDALVSYPAWLGGAAAAEYFVKPRSVLLPTIGGLLGTCALIVPYESVLLQAVGNAVGGTACVILFTCQRAKVSGWLGERSLSYFGVRSYSIYVLHFPLLCVLSAYTFAHYKERPSGLGFSIVSSILVTVFCCVCFRWIERPFLSSRRHKAT